MELNEAIRTRRSIRKFTDYQVTDDEITAMIEAARYAPSWANTQVWEFVVVRDRGLIEKIVGHYSEMNPARKCSLAASALVIACGKTGVSGCKEEGKDATALSNWYLFDLGMAVQNFCLKAHELGLGTVVVGFMDHRAIGKLISLPDGYEAVVALPLGKPAVAGKDGPPRKEQKDFVHRDRYSVPFPG